LLLPAGPLRESSVKINNSLVLHTGNQAVKLSNIAAPQFTARRALANYALRSDGSRVALDDLKQQTKLLALAGIANPEAFFNMLRGDGLNLAKTIALPDHVDFSYNFNSYLINEYAGYTPICTLKDGVKLWQNHPDAMAVPLVFTPEAAFFTAFDALLKPLLKTILIADLPSHSTT
jgi:tetraacyldisaccharide 4'-kinase